jgi:hypothetical protein
MEESLTTDALLFAPLILLQPKEYTVLLNVQGIIL